MSKTSKQVLPPLDFATSLAFVFPLLLAYEGSLLAVGDDRRNMAEVLTSGLLSPLGEHAGWARLVIWVGVGLAAAIYCYRRGVALGPGLLRTLIESGTAALVMGPLLILAGNLFGDGAPPLPLEEWYPERSPRLSEVAFVAGGAAYEELCFRLAAFSALFVVVRGILTFFGLALVPARFAAEVVGLLGSSIGFAALHLDSFTGPLGWEGEAYDARLFFWRTLAGMLLFALFRWRGFGVAAWTHALFNAGLVLGVGPGVFDAP